MGPFKYAKASTKQAYNNNSGALTEIYVSVFVGLKPSGV
jgi:hypothetical protein